MSQHDIVLLLLTVLGMTDQGMLEGRTVDGREGYFPPGHIGEIQLHRGEIL